MNWFSYIDGFIEELSKKESKALDCIIENMQLDFKFNGRKYSTKL